MADPFEDVMNLEEQFYQEGYQQGVADGAKAGKMEGRGLGLEKGYEKFMESGRLYGRSLVWASRLPQAQQAESGAPESQQPQPSPSQLPLLTENPRLKKNIVTLHALVEPETLATENSDEAVNDFDDRIKRAQGKARIIERMTGDQVPQVADKETGSNLASNVSRGNLEV
ncbi:hypothetical protein MCOR27_004288 [Pyricularia oryzae]|uniref:Essential protein Yae1 N-terminal domain-containing protein n=2 Tax=Pyricularia TaxID=48558 RepID=A0ABQ8P0G8_PYRGI|nr:hypothetical protein MCOR01_000213 [Pyricularia oryzae]KAI6304801.1 hypothetical protein MCOR33_000314 [Pyricularia grisea]KAH9428074.1 hypothetical protein MCOR02_011566 [Pyricularia oryzae]KAI6263428.1 hypothetical protein MCOR19_000329 [Pyricularia oryzae]KAI6281261.1 hypothetical protein MCOR27_004288 [Pyricularia oryzae]